MKKSLVLVAAAAMMAACSQNDVLFDQVQPSTKAESAIGFGTGMNYMTRAENSSATATSALENYHQTIRVWGYKNIMNNGAATYTSTPVFNATSTDALYAKSVLTWGNSNSSPFTTDNDWVYSPVRYWDKSADNYDFHAATPDKDFASTPVVLDWKWNQINEGGAAADWDAAAADAKGAGYFTLADFSLSGESLPINKDVTGQPNDVFGKGTTKDVDLMIAEDVTEYTNYAQRVNFDFDHILSRLNIGVKTTVTYDDESKTGVVVLESIKVGNLTNNGSFDESSVTGTTLAAGTAGRWGEATTATTYTIGFPNAEIAAQTYSSTYAATTPAGLILSDAIAADAFGTGSPAMTKDNYKYVFQGLIIPQTVAWKHLAMNGSDLDVDNDIYVEIKYNIDGEEFRAVYNLADVFTANIRYTDANGRKACKTTDAGVYVYVDETGKYYAADGTLLNTIVYTDRTTFKAGNGDILYVNDGKLYKNADFTDEVIPEAYILFGTDGKVVPVMRSEIAGACNLTFCEGWQNNLKITIDPQAILFDADVYEWATKEDVEVKID